MGISDGIGWDGVGVRVFPSQERDERAAERKLKVVANQIEVLNAAGSREGKGPGV